jgi:hypothetical protein
MAGGGTGGGETQHPGRDDFWGRVHD